MGKKYLLLTLSILLAFANRVGAQCVGGASQCQIQIEMHDSFGDGWNNGQLYVYQGSELKGALTLYEGRDSTAQVLVCSDSVTFVWSSGSWGAEVSFEVIDGNGDTLLAMSDMSDYSTGDTIAVVMNQCVTCPRPGNLHVVTRTHNQLALAWNDGGSSSWQVEYGAAGFTPGTGTTLTVTAPEVTLTGLDSAHWYDVYVTATCGSETSTPRFGHFATLCGQNTCNMVFFVRDYNWNGWQGNGIEVYQRGSLMEFLTLNNGYMDSLYVPLCHDSVTLVWRQVSEDYDAQFFAYDLSHRLLAQGENYDFYNGDTIATVMNDCNACEYVPWIDLASIDTTQISVHWHPSSANNYIVRLHNDWDSVIATATTSDTSYTFSSLQPNTNYRIDVASLCGTDTSGWSEELWLQTHASWIPIIYVSTDGDDANSGSSWSDALATTAQATSLASVIYEQYGMTPEVWVAEGTYSSRISIAPGLHIYGGLVGNEPTGYDMSQRDLAAHPTVLTYSYGNMVSQYYTLTDSTQAWVDGFTFSSGSYTVANLNDYVQLRNCTITGNTMSNSLVRVQCSNTDPNRPASLLNCSIVDNNSTGSYIVQLINARAENCLIARNSAYSYVVRLSDSSVLSHCDVVANNTQNYYAVSGSSYNNTISSLLENTIVWGNTRGGSISSYQITGSIIADHCAIQGGYSGSGNIYLAVQNEGNNLTSHYPMFADETSDFRLTEGSACINAAAGTPTTATDLAGNPRVYGTAADIGCYEWQGEIICSAVASAQVSEVTSYSARVEWRAPRSNYKLYYAPQGSTAWDSVSVDAEATGDTTNGIRMCGVTLSGLSSLTEYVVRLRTICPDSVSGDYELTFTTGCPDYVGHLMIGDTTNYTTYQGSQIPTNTYYNYGATQQIYLASELGDSTTISQLDLFYTYGSPITRRLKIFLGHTSMDAFGSSSDVIPESQLTLVYSGEYTFSNTPRMNSIQLQTPFTYNGTDNLVLAVIDSTGSWQSSGDKFMTFSAPNRSLYFSRDGSPVNFSNVTFTMGSYCNVLHMPGECDATACPTPNYSLTVGSTTATVDWAVSSTAVIQYRASTATEYITLTPGASPTTLSGLTPNTEYEVRMRNNCGASDTSRWISRTFTTLPLNLTRIYVKPTASGNATGESWANAIGDLESALQMADLCYSAYGNNCDIWVAEGTYYGDTTRSYAFGLVPGVRIYGGLVGNEPENYDLNQRNLTAHQTILDGRSQRQVAKLNITSQRQRNAVLDGVIIENGNTSSNGSGLYAYYTDLNRTIVRNNYTSSSYGGGAYLYYSNVTNCLFYGNNCYYYGGGIYASNTNIDHTDILCNTSYNYPSLYASSSSHLTNSILWGNRLTSGGSDNSNISYSYMDHCAFDFGITMDSTSLRIARANVGEDDSLHVRFASPEDHDYRLMNGSACIDMGSASVSGTDLRGLARLYGTASDMGCYEYSGEHFCLRPTQVTVSEVTAFSALISWQAETDTVVLEYALASDSQWTAITVVGREQALMPLAFDTPYLLRLKSVCGSEYSIYTDILSFHTACGAGGHGVMLGDPDNYLTTNGGNLPLNVYFNYSYTQSLVDIAEMGGSAMTIDTIYWQYYYGSACTRSIQIYLGETNKTEFASGSDMVPGNTLTEVYAGSVTFNSNNTWFAIPLQTPFNYSGTHNLVIAVVDNTGSYISSSNRFATHATDGYKSIYIASDGTHYTVGGNYSFSRVTYRPNMRIPSNCEATTCPQPSVVAVNITPNSATYRTLSMGPLQMQYRKMDSDNYIEILPADTVTITGLLQNTQYELRARTICTTGDTSRWRIIPFTTQLQETDRLYVKVGGAGTEDGTSWENATGDFNWALNTAAAIHQAFNIRPQVWVAEGTYYGDTTATSTAASSAAFVMPTGVDVYGGFQGIEPSTYNLANRDCEAHPVILDGQNARRLLYQPANIYYDSTVWDGLTIARGYSNENGGGVYLRQGGIISNCTITNCRSTSYGGGVYAVSGTVRNCLFLSDSASSGGAIYTSNNNCIVSNCTLLGNKAYYGGGTYGSGQYYNCLIANNTANYYGGTYFTSGDMSNCHIVANQTLYSSSLNYSYGLVHNSLFWGNRSPNNPNAYQINTSTTYTHCAFEGNYPDNATMVGCFILSSENEGDLTSPLFVRPSVGAGAEYALGNDWTLQEGSILIDRGYIDSAIMLPSIDLAGNPRLQNGTVDIGCYESSLLGLILPDYANGIIYVTPSGAGLRDGTSWANALDDINTASLYSSLSGHPQVWVAEGTYQGDTAGLSAFTMMGGVDVYGGFAGNEPATFNLDARNVETHLTVLDGVGSRRVLYQPTAFSTDSAVWDGFLISGGRLANYGDYGAGVYLRQGGILSNCTVTNCRAYSNGGGIYSVGGTLLNCTVTADSTNGSGGGLYASNFTTVRNCVVTGNWAYSSYGGVYLYNSNMYNSLVANNTAHSYGGIYLSSGNMYNCNMVSNLSENNNPANYIYNSTIYNSLFWGSRPNLNQIAYSDYSTFYNCAFEYCMPVNCTPVQCVVLNSANTGHLTSPRFVQPAYGAGADHANGCNWTLQEGSILIDHGSTDTTVAMPAYDLAGNPRPQNGLSDIGCYESPYSGITLPTFPDSIIYVTATGAGLRDGTSWANAMDDINEAVILSSSFGHPSIWVAEGTYYGDTASSGAFHFLEDVNLYGGFVGNEAPTFDLGQRDFDAHPTILDGQHANRVLYQPDDFTSLTVVDGFVIQNGLVTNQSGAGVILRQGGRLRNSIVQNNITLITNSNSCYGIGVNITGTSYSDTVLDHCIVRNNTYQTNYTNFYLYGGGIYIGTYATITNCEVYGNSSRYGGGIYAYYSNIYNTVVSHNQAYQYAGVYLNYNSSLYNSVVANNTASNNYGGIYGSSYNNVYNSIIWGNKVNYLANNVGNSPSIYNSAVEGGYANGTNIMELAPTNDGSSGMDNYVRFIDPNQHNYRLHPASHCLDYGDSSYSHLPLDPDGNARIMGNNIDLGAYETNATVTCPSPLNLRSLAITGTSATFAWSPQGSESQWLFTLQAANGSLDSNISLNDTTVTVSGLSLNRSYTCFVRANCGSEYSIRSPQLTITTLCDSSTLAPLSAFTSFLPADSAITNSQYVDFSWSALPEATSYDFYIWKGDAIPSTPAATGLTVTALNNYPLPNFERGAYYHWKVVAWNECINRTSPVHTFRASPYPDLHVTSITHSAPVANQPMTITWTVKNDGEGGTPQGATWLDHIWIVSDADVRLYDPNDMRGHLADIPNLQGLAAGDSYTNSVTVTLPEDFFGNYYLFVFTDQVDAYSINFNQHTGGVAPDPYTPSITGNPYPYLTGNVHHGGELPESNENDNFFYKVINILPPPSVDLQVTHISHPINAFSNSDITVSWTVTNAGQAIASPKWVDKVYIQMGGDELNLAEALHLASIPHYAGYDTVREEHVYAPSDGSGGGGIIYVPIVLGTPLDIDSSYSASATVHIPIQYSGTYTIFVVTDANDSIYEGIFEYNNEAASQQTIEVVMSPLSDLTVTSVTMPATISPRCSYPVSWTVQNGGAAATELARWRDALYLSPTPTYNSSTAIFLKYVDHNGVISIDSSYTDSTNITIPATLTGTYYLIVRTDYQDNIFEYTNEDNNERASTAPAQVVLPDLVVSSAQFENSVSVGDTLHVRAYIKNIGQGTSYYYVRTRFNAGGDWAYANNQCYLFPGDSMLVTRLVKQPCVSTTQGELTIQVDDNNQLLESNESNNSKTIAYTVNRADLTATAISHADTGWSGTTMPVTINLGNVGTVPLNDSVELTMYLSSNSTSYSATDANRMLSCKEWVQLAADSSMSFVKEITLPNGIEGNYYMHLVVDPANRICESNEGNNVTHASTAMYVNLSPYPDLIVRNLEVPDTLSVGQTVSFNFDLINQGIAAAQGNLTTKVFMSLGATYGSAPLLEVATLQQTVNIAVGDTMPNIATGMIPTNAAAGFYYFYAVTDYTNTFYEHTGESNNTVRSALTFVQIYPLDLTIDSISGPTTVDWGQNVTYTLLVTNNTNVPTSAQQWVDRLYLTLDGAIQTNSTHVDRNHTTTLLPGESYQVSFDLTIPFGSPSSLYLVGICDFNRNNPDINVANNQLTQPITVNAVPTPDLQVSDVEVIGDVVSGQPFQLAYTVTNVSSTPVAEQHWADRVTMSYTSTYSNTSQQLVLTPKDMALAAGGSYRDTINVTVPVPNQGTRFLLIQANAQLNFYETVQENNLAVLPVNITLPPPGDLVVSRIATPDTVVSGRPTTFNWTVANIGANDITGRGLSSLLYLSSDDVFDANDRLLGRTGLGQMSLASGDTMMEQLTARISGVSEGNYYLIAKTDVRNVFYEDNENNNTTVSTLPFYVKVRELLFNTPLVDTIYNGEPNDYKINVGTHRNETVRIHVESNDSLHGAVNMVYVSYNKVGDNLNYHFSTIGQYTANPELYIPSTRSGSYGVSLYGSNPSSSMQTVTITADILPFELRSINPTEGGNNGNVTVEMTGSRFRPDMKVWMLHQGDTLFADTLIYSSYYQAFARFNLNGADTGMYSMGVLNYCEGEAMLTDVFHVTEGSPDGLAYHMVFPTSPRVNRSISMMLEFGNMGNTDIEGAVLEIQSVGGTYISLTSEGLREQNTTLLIPLTIENEPEGLLRPGSYGTVTIYGYTAGSLVFAIKQVQ